MVRLLLPGGTRAVLEALGARFYALDLRKYGRSIRPWQTRGYITSLDEYDADLSAAFVAMGRAPDGRGARRLVLVGHSTGGLTLTLWAARHPGVAAALVLNSPWLEFQAGALGRAALTPLIEARAKFTPRGAQPEVDLGFYTRAQRMLGTLPRDEEREQWRPERGFPTHPAWLHAILKGHATVAAGVDVAAPALVLLSARSSSPVSWRDEMTRTDSVLVVDDVARVAPRIGRLVTIARIEDAIHDVFLSAPGPRADAFGLVDWWMRAASRREVAGR